LKKHLLFIYINVTFKRLIATIKGTINGAL